MVSCDGRLSRDITRRICAEWTIGKALQVSVRQKMSVVLKGKYTRHDSPHKGQFNTSIIQILKLLRSPFSIHDSSNICWHDIHSEEPDTLKLRLIAGDKINVSKELQYA